MNPWNADQPRDPELIATIEEELKRAQGESSADDRSDAMLDEILGVLDGENLHECMIVAVQLYGGVLNMLAEQARGCEEAEQSLREMHRAFVKQTCGILDLEK